MSIATKRKIERINAPQKVGIYMLRNKSTGNRYIGSTTNLYNRLNAHSDAIRRGYSINRKIDADIEAGHSEFDFLVLASFEDGEITNEDLSRMERELITQHGTEDEYNFPGASMRGVLPKFAKLYASGNVERRREAHGKKASI